MEAQWETLRSVVDPDLKLLDGRSVAITGAGRGLGRAYALASALHGARVVVNDIDAASAETVAGEIASIGGAAVAVPGDVAEWATGSAVVGTCVDQFGRIDCLVNNAGILQIMDPWTETEADIRRGIDVNLFGTYFPGVQAIARMYEQGSGVVINTSSGIGLGGYPTEAIYCATRAAVTNLTFSWALALRTKGVRVNAICPTGNTDMLSITRAHRATTVDWPPDWAAALAIFMMSDLSAPITGQIFRLWDRQLAVMTHPKPQPPVLDRGEPWTVGAIAAAFGRELRDTLQPIGLSGAAPMLET